MRINNGLAGLALCAAMGLLLLGCSSDSKGETPEPSPTPTIVVVSVEDGYPGAEQDNGGISIDPYPGAEPTAATATVAVAEAVLPLTLPAPASGLATIGGVLIDEDTRQAPPESLLYLGRMNYTDQGFPAVSLNRQEDPVAVLAPDGKFVFQDVEPAEYALVFFTPDYSFLVEDGDTELSLIFSVTADETLDLGLIEMPAR